MTARCEHHAPIGEVTHCAVEAIGITPGEKPHVAQLTQ
jgi:hypothetical protein